MPSTWTKTLNKLQDGAMHALIGKTIIYNVSWEDPRVDCELLNLTDNDTILMLTSGGCNVLDMALEGAKRVVAADLNPRQNALLELKIACIKTLTHEQFFQLFASNNQALFLELYPSVIRPKLGEFARGFWDENGAAFFKNVMWSGASGFAAWLLLKIARLVGLGGLIDGAFAPRTASGRGSFWLGARCRTSLVLSSQLCSNEAPSRACISAALHARPSERCRPQPVQRPADAPPWRSSVPSTASTAAAWTLWRRSSTSPSACGAPSLPCPPRSFTCSAATSSSSPWTICSTPRTCAPTTTTTSGTCTGATRASAARAT
jgi:hypothetical protein